MSAWAAAACASTAALTHAHTHSRSDSASMHTSLGIKLAAVALLHRTECNQRRTANSSAGHSLIRCAATTDVCSNCAASTEKPRTNSFVLAARAYADYTSRSISSISRC